MNRLNRVKPLYSIRSTLTLTVSIIIIFILGSFGYVLMNVANKTMQDVSDQSSQTVINQVQYDVDQYLKTVELTMDSVRYSSILRSFLNDQSYENREITIDFFESMLLSRDDIISIALVMPDGEVVTNDRNNEVNKYIDQREEDYYINALENSGMQISSSHIQKIFLGEYQWVVSCSSGFEYRGGDKAVLIIDLNFSLIEEMLRRISLGDKGYVFILDAHGDLVYHPKRELIDSGLKHENIEGILTRATDIFPDNIDDENIEYVVTSSKYSEWTIVGRRLSTISVYQNLFQRYYVVMIAAGVLISVILAWLLASTILKQIRLLLGGIREFESGKLDVNVDIEVENELGYLAGAFNDMTDQITDLIDENKQAEKMKRKYELRALQAQINPHFLYNTLDSIVWMGEAGESEEVVTMTSALAKLFRLSINKGETYHRIKDELEHVESYLKIQQMRYGDKLSYTFDVDESLMDRPIIKIILQPIIENAIYHGIKTLPGKGEIEVSLRQEYLDDLNEVCIIFEIEDNGMGMTEEEIEKLISGQYETTGKGSGVGFHNVDDRIKMHYGEKFGLVVESEKYEGTKIQFRFPLEEEVTHEKI